MDIKQITSPETIEEAFGADKAFIFKNSTVCPVSRAARGQFETFVKSDSRGIEKYMVNVIENRLLSIDIAERTGIRHQSPQLIYLEKGEPKWNMAHFEIKAENIEDALKS